MKRLISIISAIAAVCMVSSCIYDFDPQVEGTGGCVVVEGDIFAGQYSFVWVSYSQSLASAGEGTHPAIGDIYVETEDGTRYNKVSADPDGKISNRYYLCLDTRALDRSQKCRLVFTTTDNHPSPATYCSDWVSVLKTSSIDSVALATTEDHSVLNMNVTAHGTADTPYYRWVGHEIWEYAAQYMADQYYVPATNSIVPYEYGENTYYCWKRGVTPEVMIGNTETLSENRLKDYTIYSTDDRTDERYSIMYYVKLYQETISREAYEYWSNIKRNSSDIGGLFSTQPGDVRGNIHNMNNPDEYVIGYISASEVNVYEHHYKSSGIAFYFNRIAGIEPTMVEPKDWKYYYQTANFRPYYSESREEAGLPGTGDVYYWLPHRCVDCTVLGGTKTKPDGWPNSHI